jgi:membrane protein DedA with SNARE-associated domain
VFSGLEDQIVTIVEKFGHLGIALLIIAETLFPPIPSELILPLAGFMAAQGHLTPLGVMVAATLGSVAGSLILYGVAHWFGRERMHAFIRRFGRFFLLKETDLDRSEEWFNRHSGKAVLIGRLVPVVRSLISLPAGITRMPLGVFILYTAIGSAIWNGLLVGAGWTLGNRWHHVSEYFAYIEYVVIAAVLLAVLAFVWSRRGQWRVG